MRARLTISAAPDGRRDRRQTSRATRRASPRTAKDPLKHSPPAKRGEMPKAEGGCGADSLPSLYLV